MMEWIDARKIKPEPETPVLAVIDKKNPRVVRACWIPANTIDTSYMAFEGDTEYNEDDDTYYWPEGWYEWNEIEEMHWSLGDGVSHWMPLPELPSPNVAPIAADGEKKNGEAKEED